MKKLFLFILFSILMASPVFAGWSEPVRISQPGGGYYPNIIADGDTLHAVYQNQRQYQKICYVRSTDRGMTWGQPQIFSEHDGETNFPYICRWGQRLLILWNAYFSTGIYRLNIGYVISNDDGLTWTDINYIFEQNWAYPFFLTASNNDSLINIALAVTITDSMYLYNIRSTNFGQDWLSFNRLVSATQIGIPFQASSGNYVYSVWEGRFDWVNSWEIRCLRSSNGGVNWFPNYILSDSDEFHSEFPSITADSSYVLCTWMDYKYSNQLITGDIFIRTSSDYGNNWSSAQEITFNHFARKSDVDFSGDSVYVVWEDQDPDSGMGSIYFSKSTDFGETWSDPEWIDRFYTPSRDATITHSGDGIYIIWQDSGINYDSSGYYFSRWDPEPDAIGGENEQLPNHPTLSAYPNPFNSATTITLTGAEQAEIGIYDITGRLITTLHTVGGQAVWDASGISSGLYFARANGNAASTIKLVLMK